MATVRPFRGVRPTAELAPRIAALPYDVYNRKEACEEVAREPFSFLKIDRAETQFPDDVDTYDPRVYKRARKTLDEMAESGFFVKDRWKSYYLYELTMDQRSQTGIVGCASIDDYDSGVIRKHENTREEKEIDRIRHVDACDAQTGPIFLTYHRDETLRGIISRWKERKPSYDFVSNDGIRHRVWTIDEAKTVQEISDAFEKIDCLYIADGHHRCASAVKVGKMRREKNPGYTGDEEYNYFLSVLFQEDELKIYDYNRVVKDLNGLTEEEFLDRIQERFLVEENGQEQVRPQQKGEFGMYMGGSWYRLRIKEEYLSEDVVDGLDVSLLQNHLLAPVLGIENPKTDARIDFVGGIRGLDELERRVNSDCKAAFSMYPTSIAELFAVADEHRLMPPKSTWFEPKLRSGLFIHKLSD
ncbi:MAG: DUF1015 domain-containing protein [Ruminococcus sp.]|jgi:uncharacterized protein (DUF1015 family)